MTEDTSKAIEKSLEKAVKAGEKLGWGGAAALAGATIGSAALAAALLYVNRRKDKTQAPSHPEHAPETD